VPTPPGVELVSHRRGGIVATCVSSSATAASSTPVHGTTLRQGKRSTAFQTSWLPTELSETLRGRTVTSSAVATDLLIDDVEQLGPGLLELGDALGLELGGDLVEVDAELGERGEGVAGVVEVA
jgi:hypothetical protein